MHLGRCHEQKSWASNRRFPSKTYEKAWPGMFFTSCIMQNSYAQNKNGPFRIIEAMHSVSVGFDRMVPSCKFGQGHSQYYI